jgi:hypothetical protein
MGKTIKKRDMNGAKIRNRNYFDSENCGVCKYFMGMKRGCKLDKCRFEDEKLDAIKHGKIKGKRGF